MTSRDRSRSPASEHTTSSRTTGRTTTGVTATRRSHRKSRNGCRQCKQRHMKCDEHHPTCVNCSTANQQCSFSEQLASLTTPSFSHSVSTSPLPWTKNVSNEGSGSRTQSPVGIETVGLSPSSIGDGATAAISHPPSVSPAATPRYEASTPQVPYEDSLKFNLNHLALLHHLEKAKFASLVVGEGDISPLFDMIFDMALAAPYLMDELLAFSALHLSSLEKDLSVKVRYRQQATELQTRALTQFNTTPPEVRDKIPVAMFVFSSTLGLQTLFETGATFYGDLTDFLDNFVRYLTLHRGVRTIIRDNWEAIRASELRLVINPLEHYDKSKQATTAETRAQGECKRLLEWVATFPDDSPLATCRETVGALEWVVKRHGTVDMVYRPHSVAAWPVMLSAEYLELLKQRRPEALVILAHWAVLLYLDREFWVYGDTGRILVLAVTKHLGSYWDEWLAWPKEALRED